MSNDDWIKEAFQKASRQADKAGPVAVKIRKLLDNHTPDILNMWAKVEGQDKAIFFAKVLSENDEFNELVETLTECFTVAGYLFAQMENGELNSY